MIVSDLTLFTNLPAISVTQYNLMKRNNEIHDLYHCHTCTQRERLLDTIEGLPTLFPLVQSMEKAGKKDSKLGNLLKI